MKKEKTFNAKRLESHNKFFKIHMEGVENVKIDAATIDAIQEAHSEGARMLMGVSNDTITVETTHDFLKKSDFVDVTKSAYQVINELRKGRISSETRLLLQNVEEQTPEIPVVIFEIEASPEAMLNEVETLQKWMATGKPIWRIMVQNRKGYVMAIAYVRDRKWFDWTVEWIERFKQRKQIYEQNLRKQFFYKEELVNPRVAKLFEADLQQCGFIPVKSETEEKKRIKLLLEIAAWVNEKGDNNYSINQSKGENVQMTKVKEMELKVTKDVESSTKSVVEAQNVSANDSDNDVDVKVMSVPNDKLKDTTSKCKAEYIVELPDKITAEEPFDVFASNSEIEQYVQELLGDLKLWVWGFRVYEDNTLMILCKISKGSRHDYPVKRIKRSDITHKKNYMSYLNDVPGMDKKIVGYAEKAIKEALSVLDKSDEVNDDMGLIETYIELVKEIKMRAFEYSEKNMCEIKGVKYKIVSDGEAEYACVKNLKNVGPLLAAIGSPIKQKTFFDSLKALTEYGGQKRKFLKTNPGRNDLAVLGDSRWMYLRIYVDILSEEERENEENAGSEVDAVDGE